MPRWTALLASLLLFAGQPAAAVEHEASVTLAKRGEAFVVDATLAFPVPLKTAWDVLTDYDHMAAILGNLSSSQVVSRDGNTWLVRQEGVARYGPFSYAFFPEREVRVEPMKRIVSRQRAGTTRRFVSSMELAESESGTSGHYHAEIILDSGIARTFGGPFVVHEIEEQFAAMSAEMQRRKSP